LLHAISFLERRLIADRHVDVGGCQVGALLYMETVLARLFPVLESEKLHRLSLVQKSIHRCGDLLQTQTFIVVQTFLGCTANVFDMCWTSSWTVSTVPAGTLSACCFRTSSGSRDLEDPPLFATIPRECSKELHSRVLMSSSCAGAK
jgi:hypothetical protein